MIILDRRQQETWREKDGNTDRQQNSVSRLIICWKLYTKCNRQAVIVTQRKWEQHKNIKRSLMDDDMCVRYGHGVMEM